ncbi:DUF4007 family protein [Lyngbya confervoides]|uniref:DUF4007 family protein n=1 Tax=Lyngbya confervoides BDU141951 TaxID=1574623 RepID=A0ABD4T020_9CYAN|nr:DUF4007 family protein [Lyngbya confervoides]MCM1982006.1 DUF4007 family protein [Lyngbya confervoides BDU141951]
MIKQRNLKLDLQPQAKKSVFARHETFHPRFGWLKKGFDRASKDPTIFLCKDAPVRLGVGKNMVRSIRYWCGAFKLLENDQPTDFGQQLLGWDGWDPYLEDPASLWLLHWKLLEPACLATAWHFVFNYFQQNEFTVEDLFYRLSEFLDQASIKIADSSLKKDINCLLRMYVTQDARSSVSEDSLDSPFVDLGLISSAGDSKHFAFRLGNKPSLPAEVIVHACLCYSALHSKTTKSIPVSRLLYEVGSPGMIFKLTESSICGAIESVSKSNLNVGIEDSAGLLQFSFDRDPVKLSTEILNDYYDAWGENAA